MSTETITDRPRAVMHRRRPQVPNCRAARQEQPSRARAQRIESRLLTAGRAELGKQGLQALTVDHITRRARIAHGTFYLYFANKNDLLEALSRDAVAAMDRVAGEFPAVIPCWHRPAVIGRQRYIDGGVRSGTNADLLTRARVTKAYVLAPAASLSTSPPRGMGECLERLIRHMMTSALNREVALLRDRGMDVTVLTPGPEDLAAMGGNPMDSRRREAVFETSLRTSEAACPAP